MTTQRVKLRPVTPIQYDFYKRRMPELIEQFPLLFNKRFPEPLALGIAERLVDATLFTKEEIGHLLYVWCGRHEYLMMMCSTIYRMDLDLSYDLISYEHQQGYFKRVNGLNPKRIRQWARDFEIMYEMKPFTQMPDEQNPILREGYVPLPIPQFDAKLSSAIIHKLNDGNWYMTGRIWSDTHTHGNHPFRDGLSISTSRVVNISEKVGTFFVETRNTKYRIIGPISIDCDDNTFTLKQVKDELAQESIIQS